MLLNTSNRKEKIREREKQKARKKRQNAGGERSKNIFYYKKTFFSIFVFLLTVNARNFRMKLILFLETCL